MPYVRLLIFYMEVGIPLGGLDEQGLTIGISVGNRYRIVKSIGEGGMGRVYLADDERLPGQQWALKWIPHDQLIPDQSEREAQIMISLQHACLPKIVDYIKMPKYLGCCIVMDYLEGDTLFQVSQAADHRLPWLVAVEYALQLCDLLDYLHTMESPIVFRDIKPTNVIVGKDSRLRLVDFGIARIYKQGQQTDTVHIGSVAFASPELIANQQTDHRSDLYSLGSLIYFILSGGNHYNFTKKALNHFNNEVPLRLVNLVSSLLAQNPEDRLQSAQSLKNELQIFLPNDQEHYEIKQTVNQKKIIQSKQRMIITVYGLFPKVGATFIANCLTKLLSEMEQSVAYVEFPWQNPDAQLAMKGAVLASPLGWIEGTGIWRLQTEQQTQTPPSFDVADLYKILFEFKNNTVIIDISSNANPEAITSTLGISDLILAVAAPNPGELRTNSTISNWERLNNLPENNRVLWVANRMPETIEMRDFYRLFAKKPTASIPEINYDLAVAARWRGRCISDETFAKTLLLQRLSPVLDKMVSERLPKQGFRFSIPKYFQEWLAKK
jgi:serine/threonine protein kinase